MLESQLGSQSCCAKVDEKRFFVPSNDDWVPGMDDLDAAAKANARVHARASASNNSLFCGDNRYA